MPQGQPVGGQHHGHRGDEAALQGVRRHQQRAGVVAVGEHAPQEHQHGPGDGLHGEQEAEHRGALRQRQGEDGQRDGLELVPR